MNLGGPSLGMALGNAIGMLGNTLGDALGDVGGAVSIDHLLEQAKKAPHIKKIVLKGKKYYLYVRRFYSYSRI